MNRKLQATQSPAWHAQNDKKQATRAAEDLVLYNKGLTYIKQKKDKGLIPTYNEVRAYVGIGERKARRMFRAQLSYTNEPRLATHSSVLHNINPEGAPMQSLGLAKKKEMRAIALKHRLTTDSCWRCGINNYRGYPVWPILTVDHVRGRESNDYGNKRLLCPNCHSQTLTRFGSPHQQEAVRSMVGPINVHRDNFMTCMEDVPRTRDNVVKLNKVFNTNSAVTASSKIKLKALLASPAILRGDKTARIGPLLIASGEKKPVCNLCHVTTWNNIPIGFFLQLHHINGDRKNNELSNLELLCPNCHSLKHSGDIYLMGNGQNIFNNVVSNKNPVASVIPSVSSKNPVAPIIPSVSSAPGGAPKAPPYVTKLLLLFYYHRSPKSVTELGKLAGLSYNRVRKICQDYIPTDYRERTLMVSKNSKHLELINPPYMIKTAEEMYRDQVYVHNKKIILEQRLHVVLS